MSKYKVEWENEIDNALSPLEAAEDAAMSIAAGDSLAFTVTDLVTKKRYSVDLNDQDQEEVVEIGDD